MEVRKKESTVEHEQTQKDKEYVRVNIKKGIMILVLLFLSMVFIGLRYEAKLEELSKWFLENTSMVGLFSFIFINDFIISPIPPDLILVLATKSAGYFENLGISLAFGVASTLAGYAGWAFGRYVLKPKWLGESFRRFIKDNHRRINKYGKLMVALGALTPLPYSMTCWTAGFLKMDFKDFVWVASLRVLRFVLYFKILMASQHISGWLTSLSQ